MSNPFGGEPDVRPLINRAWRRQRENAAGSDSDSARKLSSGAPLIFETLEPRLLLAADPLGITAGYAFDEISGTSAADASGHGTSARSPTVRHSRPESTATRWGSTVQMTSSTSAIRLRCTSPAA